MKKISVITVCFNAQDLISNTIESILKNCDSNFEYLIIDGGSTDNTVSIAKSYADSFKKLNVDFNVQSEKDLGIYDAMNKGVINCSNDWVIFINAGDLLNQNFSKGIYPTLINSNVDIIFGDVIVFDNNKESLDKAKEISLINYSLPFCHQSVLAKTVLLKKFPFDLRFKISADYDFFLKAYLDNNIFEYVPQPISKYLLGGFSANVSNKYIKERLMIIWNNHRTISSKCYYTIRFLKTLIPINRKTIFKKY